MKKRQLKLNDGQTMTINDNEWVSVVNRKEFDSRETEIVRITRHQSGLMSRIYIMRAVDGKVVAEHNEIVVSDDPRAAATAAMSAAGLTRISPTAL